MNQYTKTSFDARLYDRNGNLLKINDGLPNQRDFVYDYRDQMIEHRDRATGITARYAYDALGRRIEKAVDDNTTVVTTRYFYDDWQEIEEQNETGATQATYVYGLYIDEVLTMERSGKDFYFHTDDIFNVRKVTASNGNVAESYEYDDYGRPTFFDPSNNPIPQSSIDNPYLFTSRRLDGETNFYYYRTRYLDSRAGRFISRDVIGIWEDLLNYGNGYSYVGNDPINYMDPFGLESCDWDCLPRDRIVNAFMAQLNLRDKLKGGTWRGEATDTPGNRHNSYLYQNANYEQVSKILETKKFNLCWLWGSGMHGDEVPNGKDYRSDRMSVNIPNDSGMMCKITGSLQVVINKDGTVYADVDKFAACSDAYGFFGHLFKEVLFKKKPSKNVN